MTEVKALEKPRYKNWIPAWLVAAALLGALALLLCARLLVERAAVAGFILMLISFAALFLGLYLCARARRWTMRAAACRARRSMSCCATLSRPAGTAVAACWISAAAAGAGRKTGQGAPPCPRHRPGRLGQGMGVQPEALRGQRPPGGRLRPRGVPPGRRGEAALCGRRVRRRGEQLRLSRSALPAGQAGARPRSPARAAPRAARSPCRIRFLTAAFMATRRHLWTPCARTSANSTSSIPASRASPPASSTPA